MAEDVGNKPVMFHTARSMRIHGRIDESRVNGPGFRAVIWLQGCPFNCPGCFNPALKNFRGGEAVPVEALIEWAVSLKGITGISISGGEPTEQIEPLNRFLSALGDRTDLSVLLFSGRTEKEISELAGGGKLLAMTDVLIAGPYDRALANPKGTWPSSTNQKIRLLTDRYQKDDFSGLPEAEIIITDQGEVLHSGLNVISDMTRV